LTPVSNNKFPTLKKFLLLFFIALAAATIINLKYQYGFWLDNSAYNFFLASILLFILSMPILLIELIFTKGKKGVIALYINTVALAFFLSMFAGKYVSGFQAILSKDKANPIIEALEKYKSGNNKYPESLNDLVPN